MGAVLVVHVSSPGNNATSEAPLAAPEPTADRPTVSRAEEIPVEPDSPPRPSEPPPGRPPPTARATPAREFARRRDPPPRAVEVDGATPESNEEAVIAAYLRHAAVFTEAGEHDRAIQSYDRAIELDPGNVDFALLRQQVVDMRDTAASRNPPTDFVLRESRTEYLPPSPGTGARRFNESSAGVSVRRATAAPEFPGELVFSVRPQTVSAGDPYVMSARLYNKGNRVIAVDAVEVVLTFDGRVEGRGAHQSPIVGRVNPRDTALLWEKRGAWGEGTSTGSVDVTVQLAGGARVKKTISW
jgi:hypothetical protein